MSSEATHPFSNIRYLDELDLIEFQHQLQKVDKQIKLVTIENAEIDYVRDGQCAYEMRGKLFFKVDKKDFSNRKQEELSDLNNDRINLAARIQALQDKLSTSNR